MKYLDTGSRDPEQSLAKWLEALVPAEVQELRIQSGFFGIGGIGLLLPIFSQHVQGAKKTTILIGSNDGATLRSDVLGLAGYMGVPRSNAFLGVVSYRNAFFHPKTYHVRRSDGSQVAYVGSANLSAAGLSLHVEAGVSFDTREGDGEGHLIEIASAIDAWFSERRAGLYLIQDIESLDALVESEVLAPAPKPRVSRPAEGSYARPSHSKATLKRVVSLPPVQTEEAAPADEPITNDIDDNLADEDRANASGIVTAASPRSHTPPVNLPPAGGAPSAQKLPAGAVNTSVPKDGFPQYLLFDPGAAGPTENGSALTGTALPSGAVGLIVQLNLDSARHFMGGTGTANISIPIATIGAIRFGVYGVHSRPRAEFILRFRYVFDKGTIIGGTTETNIQGYGYTATESGHADIRMLVPAQIRKFGDEIRASGRKVPTNGDFALLEWPTLSVPQFGLTFLEAGSATARTVANVFGVAIRSAQVVGQGACWLQPGTAPPW